MVEDRLAAHLGQLQTSRLQPAVEMRQVAAVGGAGVLGEALLQPQGIEEAVDQGMVHRGHGITMAASEPA